MDAVERDEEQRETDTRTIASTAVTPPAQPAAGRTARESAADLREEELDQRERRTARREADADQRQRRLDDRDHEVSARERHADQRDLAAKAERLDAQAVMARLGALARSLQDLDDVEATLHAIVAAAVDTVPRAAHAGLVITARRRAPTVVGSGERLDLARHDVEEGPAASALRERRTVRVDDVTKASQWPGFTARATEAGVASVLAVRLFVHRQDVGVLALYSRDPYAFDDDAEQLAAVFAAHAAVAVAGAQQEQQLHTALTTRDAIGQAKGILMERFRLTPEQAFALLVHASQDTNTKLADVVRILNETGVLTRRPG
ncbi:GAF and ANTAR domain-containing protein [Actinoplanes sp. RD1]|uniref:GAF and ANTAR domain-containing protein n=1 Tax=Actinoplanes sp. RD1 TaxID=3064538 RepID=UPI002741417B|nr:GAF and ANTAR domain-containing protein [Actinoplanes sp. RD1]